MAFIGDVQSAATGSNTLQAQLKMARDALLAQQTAMNTLSHNVANVNTKGYHRQRTIFETRHPMQGMPGTVGNGVDVGSIDRAYASYISQQEWLMTAEDGNWSAQRDMFKRVEEIVNELTEYGIGDSLNKFWNSWEDLANDVDSKTARVNVINRANDLGRSFHDTYVRLDDVREEINLKSVETVNEINNLAGQVAKLNEQIYTLKGRKQNANDLMDKRDQLIKQLSETANITIQDEENGAMTVYLGNDALVFMNKTREVEWRFDETGEKGKSGGTMVWAESGEELQLSSGTAHGELLVRDEITSILEGLDTLADQIRDRVNTLHVQGIALDGSSGNVFFRNDIRGALTLTAHKGVEDSPEKIAASTVHRTGDNSLAHDIYNVQFETPFAEGEATYNDFYQSWVIEIGEMVESTTTKAEAAEAGLQQAENWQQQYTGVNLDEEMSNMISIQFAFQAASKVAQSVDEMLRTVLATMGG